MGIKSDLSYLKADEFRTKYGMTKTKAKMMGSRSTGDVDTTNVRIGSKTPGVKSMKAKRYS